MPRHAGSAGRPRRRRAGRDGRRHRLAGRACAGCRWLASTRSTHRTRSAPRTATAASSARRTSSIRSTSRWCSARTRSWAELEASAGTRLFQACGGLMIGRPGSALVDGTLRAAAEHALPVQTWDGQPRCGRVCPRWRQTTTWSACSSRGPACWRRSARVECDARPGAARWRAPASCHEPVRGWTARAGHVDVRSDEPARARPAPRAGGRSLAGVAARRARAAAHRRACRAALVSPRPATSASRRRRSPSSCSRRRTVGCSTGCPIRDVASSSPSITAAGRPRRMTVDRQVAVRRTRRVPCVCEPVGPRPAQRPRPTQSVCLYTNTPDSDFLLDWHPARPRGLRLQRLLGSRLQVRAGHRRGGGLGCRHGRVAARSGAVPPGAPRLSAGQGRATPVVDFLRSV